MEQFVVVVHSVVTFCFIFGDTSAFPGQNSFSFHYYHQCVTRSWNSGRNQIGQNIFFWSHTDHLHSYFPVLIIYFICFERHIILMLYGYAVIVLCYVNMYFYLCRMQRIIKQG